MGEPSGLRRVLGLPAVTFVAAGFVIGGAVLALTWVPSCAGIVSGLSLETLASYAAPGEGADRDAGKGEGAGDTQDPMGR